ncbi:hypothetical protein ACFLSY_05555 [Bacteroidota bacterium]
MKNYFKLVLILLLVSCINNNSGTNQQQKSYELRFDKLVANFQEKSQTKNINGKIILFKHEIQVIQGNEGEKFTVKEVEKNENELIIYTENNQNIRVIFRFSMTNNVTRVKMEFEGVGMNFNITYGSFKDIKVYNTLSSSINCDCETIHRDDGTVIKQCNTLPVSNDNTSQIALAVSSNGVDNFVCLTVRFASTAQNIKSGLSFRLIDNNLLTIPLIKKELGRIGNSEVAMGIFNIDDDQMRKLKYSQLMTLSFRLDDGLTRTYDCKLNKDVLTRQLNCI